MWRDLANLIFVLFAVLFLWFRGASGAETPSPKAEVKETIQALKTIVSSPALKGEVKKQERRARIRELILERMDFNEMAKRSLGRHWKDRTEAERAEYVGFFSKYVEAFYRKSVFESIEFMDSLDIKYLKEGVGGDFAEVDIQIVAKNNTKQDLTFKLHFVGGHWKVYDVIVENISEVNNWRAQFDRVITQHSFSELLSRLRERIEVLNK